MGKPTGEGPPLDENLTLSANASRGLIVTLLEDQQRRWERGEPVLVGDYLEHHPALKADPESLVKLIANEMRLREQQGETPEPTEYAEQFPTLAASILHRLSPGHSTESKTHTLLVTVPPTPPPSAHSGPPADVDPSWPVLPDYEISGMLGRGGMGVVYRAYDRKRKTKVALKTVQRAGPSALYRFKQEFRTLLDVSHPNLVNLYELVSDGDNWFFTMELVEGVDFLEYVRQGGDPQKESAKELQRILSTEADTEIQATRPPDHHVVEASLASDECRDPSRLASPIGLSTVQRNRLRTALKQLAEGVGALHDAGKLHRDIKPSNVMVTRSGRVVLLDFGLAAEQGRGGLHQSTADEVVGTAAYMAPEQAAGTPVSPASDWYSVGVVLYEALTGRLPFVGGYMQVLMDKQRFEPPPPCELVADVPDDLNALCVDLLRQRPEARPSGREVLRRLGTVPSGHEGKPSSRSSLEHAAPLIGRERHRESLREAFEAMSGGNPVLLFVSGRSGVGKSVLVQRFLTDLIEQGQAVVLAGRCYERESVPYKALDSLIDALSRYLRLLPVAEAKALLPRDVPPLTRVFPVLRRAQAVSEAEIDAPRRAHEIPEPQELRRRAFTALRELLARLGDRKPLVLAIDDLQWGDVDSAALLSELLRPPDPPVLLLLASYRSEDAISSPFLQAFHKPDGLSLDRRELVIEALTPNEARDLALALLGPDGKGNSEQADAIARESGGNPLFVAELARHVQVEAPPAQGPGPAGGITLDEVLWQRISRLPDDARRLLEVVAVSSRPLRQTDACQCAERLDDERAAMGVLRSGRLIRGAGPTAGEEVETYHDRIRETVLAHLPPAVLSDHHRRLARVLEASGSADPEALGVHFHGAGELEKAGRYYDQAGGRAAETLAFERAAALYRLSLECRPLEGDARRTLQARLGDALANAGRGAEAAHEYLEAASGATIAAALELQRRAAMQYLISGHVDDGLAAIRTVLEAVGMTLPNTPRRALVSLLIRRAWLRIRGLGFRSRDTSEVAAADLTRIDVCWSAAAGLSVVDTIRGADFQARGLLLALRAGEPFRIARSLAMEAAQTAIPGVSAKRRTARLLALAGTLAKQADAPHALGLVTLAQGVSAYLEGRWRDALQASDAGETILRDRCQGVAWEIDTAHAFSLWSLSHLGAIAELNRRWPVLLKEARERGDLYAVMNLSTYIMAMVRLAADSPIEAREELLRTMSQWSRQGYHVQHNDELWAAALIELYRGDGPAAWKLVSEQWPALARSLLLRVQFIRTSMYFLRARCALAAATATRSATLIKVAARDARHLEREKIPYAKPYARLIRAGIAAAQGDLDAAKTGLADAAAGFDSVEMQLCAASARRVLGEFIGGDEGQDLLDHANTWMTGQGIRNPGRMAAMYVTGFPSPTA
ncbi:protein kinase [Singulisphaera sp. Ch08]|uniref:non-specific serine/threonine protein kinase n=1 Tax=Singulisphaera sp. Ch08 TaxID=3120278 RepID=A0AAU7CGM6_9BACT